MRQGCDIENLEVAGYRAIEVPEPVGGGMSIASVHLALGLVRSDGQVTALEGDDGYCQQHRRQPNQY